MEIEKFVSKSAGQWSSMRSGHSLAFKQFEEIVSNIRINLLSKNDTRVEEYLDIVGYSREKVVSPFEIEWIGESNWADNSEIQKQVKGHSLLIPIKYSINSGIILRSKGYAEDIQAITEYVISSDGTIIFSSAYQQTIAEERIWFIHQNVRCRSSVIRSKSKGAILQTSFASEVRKVSK